MNQNHVSWPTSQTIGVSILVFSLLLFAPITGCTSEEAERQMPAAERFALGMELFNDEDYLQAIEEFKVVTLQYQATAFADDAQFYMAESRMAREEFILAAFEYEILLRTMPTSEFVSRARFQRATCYYNMSPSSRLDQENSRKAIDEYQAFIEYHPTDSLATVAEQRITEMNTKLAQKDFDNGITYLRLEYNKAAVYYFDLVLEKYHDTPYAEPALLRKAQAQVARKRYAEAKEALDRFREKYPNSALGSDAETLQADVTAGLAEKKAATKQQGKL